MKPTTALKYAEAFTLQLLAGRRKSAAVALSLP